MYIKVERKDMRKYLLERFSHSTNTPFNEQLRSECKSKNRVVCGFGSFLSRRKRLDKKCSYDVYIEASEVEALRVGEIYDQEAFFEIVDRLPEELFTFRSYSRGCRTHRFHGDNYVYETLVSAYTARDVKCMRAELSRLLWSRNSLAQADMRRSGNNEATIDLPLIEVRVFSRSDGSHYYRIDKLAKSDSRPSGLSEKELFKVVDIHLNKLDDVSVSELTFATLEKWSPRKEKYKQMKEKAMECGRGLPLFEGVAEAEAKPEAKAEKIAAKFGIEKQIAAIRSADSTMFASASSDDGTQKILDVLLDGVKKGNAFACALMKVACDEQVKLEKEEA